MGYQHRHRGLIGVFFALFLPLGGCTTSTLQDFPLSSTVQRALSSADCHSEPSRGHHRAPPCVRLLLKFDSSLQHQLGSQYFLFFLPIGATDAGELTALTFHTLLQELLLAGYTPQIEDSALAFHPEESSDLRSEATVSVHLKDISLTTYDLLFTRKVKTEITLTVRMPNRDQPVSVTHSRSSYHRLPFSRVVSQEYRATLRETFKKALQRLSLSPSTFAWG